MKRCAVQHINFTR